MLWWFLIVVCIGKVVFLDYGIGVVIGEIVVIGDCVLML